MSEDKNKPVATPQAPEEIMKEAPKAEEAPKMPATGKGAAKKPSRLAETRARNKKALTDALARAQSVRIEPTPARTAPARPAKVAKPEKPAKPEKHRKPKLVRDSFAMPEAEYAQIAALKKRMARLGGDVKKSELLRAGIALLSALEDTALTAVMARVERVKTGRPAK